MIKNPDLLRKVEADFVRHEGQRSYSQSLQIFTDLWNEGVSLGVLPSKEPMEGIEVDIRIAKVLNSCLKNSYRK